MNKYNYLESIKEDVKNYIKENYESIEEINKGQLYDDLFIEDSVTGNGSGSYTFSTWEAEENIAHNMDLLSEALEEFGCDSSYIADKGAEACDVTIRCYLLGQAIDEALEELEDEADE